MYKLAEIIYIKRPDFRGLKAGDVIQDAAGRSVVLHNAPAVCMTVVQPVADTRDGVGVNAGAPRTVVYGGWQPNTPPALLEP